MVAGVGSYLPLVDLSTYGPSLFGTMMESGVMFGGGKKKSKKRSKKVSKRKIKKTKKRTKKIKRSSKVVRKKTKRVRKNLHEFRSGLHKNMNHGEHFKKL
tara:strand:- start:101 stop:400 length:300 start_codon:yes stop_codon:yes gene_type:complete